MKIKIGKFNILMIIAAIVLLSGCFYIDFSQAQSAFNEEMNYQGKLMNPSEEVMPDASYNFRFKLCATSDCSGGGDPIWTETRCYSPDNGSTCDGTGTDQRIATTDGLFSILLGDIASLSSIDFNQDLWLEVSVGGSGSTPSWETLTPRKQLGTVPSAFEAGNLGGKDESEYATLAENETISGLWTYEGASLYFNDSDSQRIYRDSTKFGLQAKEEGPPVGIDFRGDDYVSVPDDNTLDLTTFVAMTAWIKTDGTGTRTIIGKWTGMTFGTSSYIMTLTDGYVECAVANGSTPGYIISSLTVNDDDWHLISCIYDGSVQELHVYVDGANDDGASGETVPATINSTSIEVTIGAARNDSDTDYSWYFDGLIDDPRVYSSLTSGQIATLYSDPTDTSGTIVSRWKLDENMGTSVEDDVGSNGGTLNDATLWSTGYDGFPNINQFYDIIYKDLSGKNVGLVSNIADSASAVAFTSDTVTELVTEGAKLWSFRNRGTEVAYIDKDGSAYFNGGLYFDNGIDLSGDSAQTIGMRRNTAEDTAGNNLILNAGGPISGSTSQNGGDLILSSGLTTGMGVSNIYFQTPTPGLNVSDDNTPTTKMTIDEYGRVGIGTSDPSYTLQVKGGLGLRIEPADHSSGATLSAAAGGGGELFINTDSKIIYTNSSIIAYPYNETGDDNLGEDYYRWHNLYLFDGIYVGGGDSGENSGRLYNAAGGITLRGTSNPTGAGGNLYLLGGIGDNEVQDGNIILAHDGADAMDSSVGIGTNAPWATLSIMGNIGFGSSSTISPRQNPGAGKGYSLTLRGGEGASPNNSDGDGGDIFLISGAGSIAAYDSGIISIETADVSGGGTAGDVDISGGDSATGSAGNINLTAGATGAPSGAGNITLTAGNNTNEGSGAGGEVYIIGGDSTASTGGKIYIYGGTGTTAGNIVLAHTGSVAQGKVGVGTNAPGYLLDVAGAIRTGVAGTDGQLRIYSEQGETDYEVIFNPNTAMTQDTTYTLPADDGDDGDVLATDGSGALSWEAAAENLWQRNGTILSPATAGDTVTADGGLTIGAGSAGLDYALTFDGETNNGVLTWMEDEDYFQFSDNIYLPASTYAGIGAAPSATYGLRVSNGTVSARFDGDIYIMKSESNTRFLLGDSASSGDWGGMQWDSASNFMKLRGSSAVENIWLNADGTTTIRYNTTIGAGAAGIDYALNFNGETYDGALTWMEDEDYFKFSDDILMDSTEKIYFRDSALSINSATDGYLDLSADTGINLNSAAVVGGNLTIGTGSAGIDYALNFNGENNDVSLTWLEDEAQLTVNSDLLPSADDTYDLGDSTHRWQDLYLGPSTLHIGADSDEAQILYNTTSDLLTFQNSTDAAAGFQFLDADGGTPILNVDTANERVGIGTVAPSAVLDVKGVFVADPDVADGGSAVAYLFDTVNTLSTGGAKIFSVQNNGTEKMYIDKDGGIYLSGALISKPEAFDYVYNFDGSSTYTNNTAESQTSGGTPFTMLAAENPSDDYLYAGFIQEFNSVYINIETAGVGVTLGAEYYNGSTWTTLTVTDNTSDLTVDGSITFAPPSDWTSTAVNGQTKYWIRLKSTTQITTAPTANSISPSTGARMEVFAQQGDSNPALYVDEKGNVGIGTSSPSYQLQLSQDSAAKPVSNTWTVVSDLRLKKDVLPFLDGLDIIRQIEPVKYTLNGLGSMPEGAEGIGIIAQEVQDIIPYTVGTYKAKLNPDDEEETEFLTFNSSALTFVMINAIKELENAMYTLMAGGIEGVSIDEYEAIGAMVISRDLLVKGHITVNKDTAGKITVPSGSKINVVDFQKEYDTAPIVTLTLLTQAKLDWYRVQEVTVKGFTVEIEPAQGMDIEFNWMAVAVDGSADQTSNLAQEPVLDPAPVAVAASESLPDSENNSTDPSSEPTEPSSTNEDPAAIDEENPDSPPAEDAVSETPATNDPTEDAPVVESAAAESESVPSTEAEPSAPADTPAPADAGSGE